MFLAAGGMSEDTPVAAGDEVLSWDKKVHDFGDVSVTDGPLSCSFTLTNNGSEPITIFEVVSSCGCTDVKWTKKAIQPGQSGTISATYKNEDGPMPFDKTLTAYISGVKKPVILRLRGVVHEKKKSPEELYGAVRMGDLGMKSRTLNAGTLRQGLSTSETITLANLGKKSLKLAFADVSEQLTVSAEPNPIPAGGTATLTCTVKADPGLYGRQVYKATPVVNGKKASAPIEITAWTQENFSGWTEEQRKKAALPYFDQSTFNYGSVKRGEKLEVTFHCNNRGKSALHIYQADAEDPALQPVNCPDIPAGKRGDLRFTLDTSRLEKGENVIMISLTTNSPLRPLINLFVAGIID